MSPFRVGGSICAWKDANETLLKDNSSPPYAPAVWQYGGIPSVVPDVILCALYLVAYLAAGITHHAVFIKNKKAGRKFVMSAMSFGTLYMENEH